MLRFFFLGIPVGVHFSFLFVAVLGWSYLEGAELVVFVLAIFLAVLIHEAGHALTARRFGATSVSITLFALGGVTVYSNDPPLPPGRRFLISGAGSAAGIAAGGPVLLLLWQTDLIQSMSRLPRIGLSMFAWAAAVWGVANWIPIRPLDGGQMLGAALEIAIPRHADVISRVVTVVVGATAIIVAVAYEEYFIAFFVAFLVFTGTRRVPTATARHRPPPQEPRPSKPAEEEPEEFPI